MMFPKYLVLTFLVTGCFAEDTAVLSLTKKEFLESLNNSEFPRDGKVKKLLNQLSYWKEDPEIRRALFWNSYLNIYEIQNLGMELDNQDWCDLINWDPHLGLEQPEERLFDIETMHEFAQECTGRNILRFANYLPTEIAHTFFSRDLLEKMVDRGEFLKLGDLYPILFEEQVPDVPTKYLTPKILSEMKDKIIIRCLALTIIALLIALIIELANYYSRFGYVRR